MRRPWCWSRYHAYDSVQRTLIGIVIHHASIWTRFGAPGGYALPQQELGSYFASFQVTIHYSPITIPLARALDEAWGEASVSDDAPV
jgi:hypothetical protein